MSQFMIELDLPEFTEEFVAKIPQQRLKINEFLEKGKIHSYAVSVDRSKVWCVINAASEMEAFSILAEFPLHDFLSLHSIYELMFNNSVVMKIPAFSLN